MIKRQFKLFLSALAVWMAGLSPSYAAMATDVIHFSFPVTDVSAGTGRDFSFTHSWPLSVDADILSATVSITHNGNADEGPRTEIWSLNSEDGTRIRLGPSLKEMRTDSLAIPSWLWPANFSLPVSFFLSEETAYNGETLTLLESKLEVEYREAGAPEAPEPAGLAMMSGALTIWGFLSKRRLKNLGRVRGQAVRF